MKLDTAIKCLQCIVVASLLVTSQAAIADLVVIGHPDNPESALTEKDVKKIFLGKSKYLPSGTAVTPVDQSDSSSAKQDFYQKVAGMNPSQLARYWAKLVFSGKGSPPPEEPGDLQIKARVASNPNTIGYVDASVVDESVKILLRIE